MSRAKARRYSRKPMQGVNIEFKARMGDEKRVRAALKGLRPRVAGRDHQIDTYFQIPSGRLKLRQGNIENALIFYQRQNMAQVRPSRVLLCEFSDPSQTRMLKKVLASALGIAAVVDKVREIYYVGNIKIHLDRVRGLGKFLEVEAFVGKGSLRRGRKQADEIKELFGVLPEDILAHSYSDLILERHASRRKRRG